MLFDAMPVSFQSIPGSGKDFYVCLFCLVVVVFLLFFLGKNTLLFMKFCNFFCNGYSFRILNILQNLWPIKRVSRYIDPASLNVTLIKKSQQMFFSQCIHIQVVQAHTAVDTEWLWHKTSDRTAECFVKHHKTHQG